MPAEATTVLPEHGYRAAMTGLRRAQKSSRGVSLYSSRVNRPLGRRLAALAAVARLRPIHVTLLSAASSAIAVAIVASARATPWLGLVSGAALITGFALDSADGQLARLQGSSSAAGEWFDHVIDCALKLCLHLGVLINWYDVDAGRPLLVPLGFQVVAVLLFFGGILVEKLRPAGVARTPARRPVARQVLLLPVDNGVLCCAFLLWGLPQVFLGLYTALFVAHLLYLIVFCHIWYRELS